MGNNSSQHANANNHSIPLPRQSMLYTSTISQEQVDLHIDLFKSGIKLLLFGCNRGKSSWFNESIQSEPLTGITFKVQSFTIDSDISKIKAIIYDTAEEPKYLNDTLKYIPSISPNGIILTYNPHNIETLNHLQKSIQAIHQIIDPNVLFLLLGIEEHNSSNADYRDVAHKFATKHNLFHLQIDISCNNFLKTEPYIYFLRKIVKFMEKKDDSLVNMIRELIEISDDDEEEAEQKVQAETPIDAISKVWREQPGSVDLTRIKFENEIDAESENDDEVDEYVQKMNELISKESSTTATKGQRSRTESFATNLNKFVGNTTDHLDAIFEEMENENEDNASSTSQPPFDCDSDEKIFEHSRVHSRIPKHRERSKNLSKIPASFKRFKSYQSEQEEAFDIDAELRKAEHQMMWERYVAKYGKPQKAEQFMSWTKRQNNALSFVEAMQVIKSNGHTVFENIEHQKLEAARPYQLEFQDNTKQIINAESGVIFDADNACQLEFERFFIETMGKARAIKYMGKFNEKCYNDIRLVDPDIFDADWMQSDDIEMNVLDKKLFKREVQKYKDDCNKFESLLDSMKMKEKYHKSFVNRGIQTLWSFYHHIHSSEDILRIVNNQQHAKLIWNELKIEEDEKKPIERIQIKQSREDIVLPESNESLSPFLSPQIEGNGERKSDSEEFYENDSEEEQVQKQIDTPTTNMSELDLMAIRNKKSPAKRKRKRKKKQSAFVENVKWKKEESVSFPKLHKKKIRKRKKKIKKEEKDEKGISDIMPLNEVQKLFVEKLGKKPVSVKQLLSFCQQNDIQWKFKHINKWWRDRPDI